MKKQILIFICFFIQLGFLLGQDILLKRDSTKIEVKVLEITPTEVKFKLFSNPNGPTYILEKNNVSEIIYKNGLREVFENSNIITISRYNSNEGKNKKETKLDSTRNYNFIKFQFTSLLLSKVTLGYERIIHGKYSIELEPSLIFQGGVLDGPSQFFYPNVAFRSSGGEFKIGINKFFSPPNIRKILSRGVFISYRYQHIDHFSYWDGGISGASYHSTYVISQTKNLCGIFWKVAFCSLNKKACVDVVFNIGGYFGYSRTVCFAIYGYSGASYPMGVYNVPIYQPNGFTFIPVIKLGLALRIKS